MNVSQSNIKDNAIASKNLMTGMFGLASRRDE
jgi:hypothetical protein